MKGSRVQMSVPFRSSFVFGSNAQHVHQCCVVGAFCETFIISVCVSNVFCLFVRGRVFVFVIGLR